MEAPNLRKSFQDSILKACDKLCGKKIIRKDREGTRWWNKEVQNVTARKVQSMLPQITEQKTKYNSIRTKAKAVVARAMKMEANKDIETFFKIPKKNFRFLKIIKREKMSKAENAFESIDGRLGVKDIDRKKNMERAYREHHA